MSLLQGSQACRVNVVLSAFFVCVLETYFSELKSTVAPFQETIHGLKYHLQARLTPSDCKPFGGCGCDRATL